MYRLYKTCSSAQSPQSKRLLVSLHNRMQSTEERVCELKCELTRIIQVEKEKERENRKEEKKEKGEGEG